MRLSLKYSSSSTSSITTTFPSTGARISLKFLLTTLFGLVCAMILQVFYNYLISVIDRLVGDMEEASVELIDALYEVKNK